MTEANKQPSKALGPGFSQCQYEEPPQLSCREISIVRSATYLSSIIAGNCLCSGFICLCLWGFTKFKDLSSWEKRAFNTLSLLLIAILGFGIGFLFDQIGLLARGTLLQRKSHSSKGVAYILRGSLLSYSSLLIHETRTWRRLTPSTTWVLFLFILCSLFGRFGVAFLGFAFNLEISGYIPPLFRPDWANGTLEGDDSPKTSLVSAMSIHPSPSQGRAVFTEPSTRDIVFEGAQALKGLPWFFPRTDYYYLNTSTTITYAMNISHFSNGNLTMEVLDGNKVSFRYKFQDFKGVAATPAGWEALLKTSCQRFDSAGDMVIPIATSNFTTYPGFNGSSYRWIYSEPLGRLSNDFSTQIPRNETVQMCEPGASNFAFLVAQFCDYVLTTFTTTGLVGQSPETVGPSRSNLAPQDMENAYAGNKTILFNCSIYLVDSPTDPRSDSSLGVYDRRPSWWKEPRPDPDPSLGIHIIGQFIHALLRLSPVSLRRDIWHGDILGKYQDFPLGPELENYDVRRRKSEPISPKRDIFTGDTLENYRDFPPSPEFDYGVSRKDRSASELWLAAYIGNYIGNCLSFLNDYLRRVKIHPEIPATNTKLVVKWVRAATTLGALAAL